MRFIILLITALTLSTCVVAVQAAPSQRSKIETEEQFTNMARISAGGRYASFQQMMFVIDRGRADKPRLHFVNSKKYDYHIAFIRGAYLSTQSADQLDSVSYSEPDRRFILGSIVRYQGLDRYGVEFWEGDVLTKEILQTTLDILQPAFPEKLTFKPNSELQENVARSISGLPVLNSNQIYGSRKLLVLNAGKAVGKLRILPKITDGTIVRRDEIIILDETPLRLDPVAGIITTEFSTPLSHVNLLAKSWRVPNGYLRGAAETYKALDGQWVSFKAKTGSIEIRAASAKEIAKASEANASKSIQIARADLNFRELPALDQQRADDVIRTGTKAANLGEVAYNMRWGRPDFIVPAGFSIPFAYYDDFIRLNGIDGLIDDLLNDPKLRNDPKYRREKLSQLRNAFDAGVISPMAMAKINRQRTSIFGEDGLFVRSSTNAEDLPGFNGAGLYTTVPNVTDEASLSAAIKKVWGSVWNDRAFEARDAAGIDHKSVMASVLVQLGINADAAGVMITENPFDPSEDGAVFINAKRGLGIRVVEGRKVAEQLLYRSYPESIQILTRSTDDVMLSFDEDGGVKEVAVEPGRLVLTDEKARRLARIGKVIARYFGNKPQDIEWLFVGEQLYIVQSRPYLSGD